MPLRHTTARSPRPTPKHARCNSGSTGPRRLLARGTRSSTPLGSRGEGAPPSPRTHKQRGCALAPGAVVVDEEGADVPHGDSGCQRARVLVPVGYRRFRRGARPDHLPGALVGVGASLDPDRFGERVTMVFDRRGARGTGQRVVGGVSSREEGRSRGEGEMEQRTAAGKDQQDGARLWERVCKLGGMRAD